jgi:ribonuclease VapC
MVIDTSARVTILASEAGVEQLKNAIHRDATRLLSVASALETSILLETGFGEAGTRELDPIVQQLPIELTPVDWDQLEWARFAYHTYGRGRHPAKLNCGD